MTAAASESLRSDMTTSCEEATGPASSDGVSNMEIPARDARRGDPPSGERQRAAINRSKRGLPLSGVKFGSMRSQADVM